MDHQKAFCFITLREGIVTVLSAKVCDFPAAEKYAKDVALHRQEPVYIMRAAVKVVPPEPVCTIVPLKAAFEVG